MHHPSCQACGCKENTSRKEEQVTQLSSYPRPGYSNHVIPKILDKTVCWSRQLMDASCISKTSHNAAPFASR
ncbi:conserved hypothetical protein [Ricinus communis]|uniref:Uncharacterized protein n=1 Tax=Ricinus communis TaxID=3988 RepID=B9SBE3_RICCO|nr:conserved hypothetical protein [Ricinus communis]